MPSPRAGEVGLHDCLLLILVVMNALAAGSLGLTAGAGPAHSSASLSASSAPSDRCMQSS